MLAILGLRASLLDIQIIYYCLYHPMDTSLDAASSTSLGVTCRRVNKFRGLVDLWLRCNILVHLVAFWGHIPTIQLDSKVWRELLRWRGFKFWGSEVVPFIVPSIQHWSYSLYPSWILGVQPWSMCPWYCIIIYFVSLIQVVGIWISLLCCV